MAALLPADFCFRFGVIPFDVISRSVLIATANPFDAGAREHVKATVDYNVFWYLTTPSEITAALRRAHGLESKSSNGVRTEG